MQERKGLLRRTLEKMRIIKRIKEPAPSEKPHISEEEQKRLNNELLEAAENGYNEEISRLLKKGANLEAKNSDGWTALMHAAAYGHAPACALLLEKGANIEAKDKDGWTALMFAAYCGRTPTCALLIEKGADVNAKIEKGDYKGKTASSIAEANDKRETAAFLKSIKILQGWIGNNGMQDFLADFRACLGK
jgi:serine/threonine/tyrosine protein kinase RAD53